MESKGDRRRRGKPVKLGNIRANIDWLGCKLLLRRGKRGKGEEKEGYTKARGRPPAQCSERGKGKKMEKSRSTPSIPSIKKKDKSVPTCRCVGAFLPSKKREGGLLPMGILLERSGSSQDKRKKKKGKGGGGKGDGIEKASPTLQKRKKKGRGAAY